MGFFSDLSDALGIGGAVDRVRERTKDFTSNLQNDPNSRAAQSIRSEQRPNSGGQDRNRAARDRTAKPRGGLLAGPSGPSASGIQRIGSGEATTDRVAAPSSPSAGRQRRSAFATRNQRSATTGSLLTSGTPISTTSRALKALTGV